MIAVDYRNGNWFDRLWRWVYPASACLLLLALVLHHWQIIVAPFPLDYYEGTTLLITQIFAEGGNPYTQSFQPAAMYVYPPLYNLLVAPLSYIFSDPFMLHRGVCAVFIMLSSALVYRAVLHAGGGNHHALAAAAICYAGLLFYATPISSTNALGVLLYLLCLYIPWRRGFTPSSLWWAVALGVASFYAKQYFILGMGIICSWLLLYRSVYSSFRLGLIFSGALVASLSLVHLSSPYFLDNTLFSTAISAGRLQNSSIALLQYRDLAILYWPLIALLAVQLIMTVLGTNGGELRDAVRSALPRLHWNEPGRDSLERTTVGFFWLATLVCSVIVFLSLARNPGNYLSYLFQLLSPLLLIATFAGWKSLPAKVRFAQPLVLIVFYQVWALLPQDFSSTPDGWKRVDTIAASEEHIFASQMLVAALLKHDREVYQDGHTFYFPLAADKPAWFIKENHQQRVTTIWETYIADLYRGIADQKFDAIMLTSWDFRGVFVTNPPHGSELSGRDFLLQYYKLSEVFPLSMTGRHGGGTYEMRVWRPRELGRASAGQNTIN